MRHSLLLVGALGMVLSSASAIAPGKRYMKNLGGAGLTRSLLTHGERYLAGVRAQWKNQPVQVAGGYKRYTPFTVLTTTANVEKSDSPFAPYVGYLTIRVRYRETALFPTPQQALKASLKAEREFQFEPMFSYHQGKWVASSEE